MGATIQKMREAGFTLAVVEGALRVSPADKLSEVQRAYLRAHRTELIAALQEVNEPATLIRWRDCTPEQINHLWNRVKQGEAVQIYSDTLKEAVYWVRDEALADELRQQGIAEVAYSMAELKELASLAPEFLRNIHTLKKWFDASLVKADKKESAGG